jgi:hypothetical protein
LERLEDRQSLSVALLVSDTVNHNVERYDGTAGQRIDTFVTSGSGGLEYREGPGCGPDANLYVGQETAPGRVLRYDRTTGEFLNSLASAGGRNLPA